MKNYIIGAGGAGSWLTAAMVKLIGPKNIILVDGDTLEQKNLDRQLFTEEHIGQNKAEALARLHNCEAIPDWYSMDLTQHFKSDFLLVAVDNHPARNSALNACDFAGCSAIFGANETHSAEAYVYKPEWKGTRLDPRTYYPEIATNRDDDPRAGAIGCTGEAQVRNRQLVSANFMAAALMMHLYVVWQMEAPKLDVDTLPHLPHHLSSTLSRLESIKEATA